MVLGACCRFASRLVREFRRSYFLPSRGELFASTRQSTDLRDLRRALHRCDGYGCDEHRRAKKAPLALLMSHPLSNEGARVTTPWRRNALDKRPASVMAKYTLRHPKHLSRFTFLAPAHSPCVLLSLPTLTFFCFFVLYNGDSPLHFLW